MSLDINVYCKNISEDLIPKIVKRLNEFDMDVEIHPNFKFNKEDEGFLPFKFRFKNTDFEFLKDRYLVSGFEIYISDFDLLEEKDTLIPKTSFIDKLFRRKSVPDQFAPIEIEKRLEDCTKNIIFVWHAIDSFELRFATLTSAILSEITNGVCYYSADAIWYENENIVDEAFKEAKEYEKTFTESTLKFHEFENW